MAYKPELNRAPKWAGNVRSLSRIALLGGAVSLALPLLPFADVVSFDAVASETAADGGGKARINLAEELTIFSQSMAAAACSIDLGYDVEYEMELLKETHDEFVRMLHALEFGDPALGVPTKEHYSKAIKAIRALHVVWDPYNEAVKGLIAGDHPHEHAKAIADHNQEVLEAAEILASIIVAEHTNPSEVMLSDAIAITIAERQEMLTQKLKREACEIEGNHASDDVVQDFHDTITLFENSLIALRDGFPAAGVRPPPNDEIKYELNKAWEEWQKARPVLESIHANSTAAEEEMIHVREVMDELDHTMHIVVIEYLLSTPGSDDIYKIPMMAYLDSTLKAWVEDPLIIAAVMKANVEHANLTEDDMHKLEEQWEAEIAAGSGPLTKKLDHNPASDFLHKMQSATADIVTEVFIMDAKGLNVAESEVTSEYWHAEDERWKLTFGNHSGDIHISPVHLEEGGHVYQSQISIPVRDPDTGKLIGAATFGINIQAMF